jgi:hypothetical protein
MHGNPIDREQLTKTARRRDRTGLAGLDGMEQRGDRVSFVKLQRVYLRIRRVDAA